MKKIHQAYKRGNKWVRRTKWELDVEDYVSLGIFVMVVGFVVIRVLLG
ncbi:MAG: hypothetical protein J6Q48_01720 [Bacteroidaceae bacterium]|nr:hypothetical protein [Bacteroidaceae bacterium]